MRVLLIEDEAGLGDAVSAHLAGKGYAVDWVREIGDALAAMRSTEYGIVLLDINLPDGNGVDLLKVMRAGGDVRPVMIISSRDQLSDRIGGLNTGADDYITKPFELDELIARVEAIGRRYSGSPNPALNIGGVSIDTANRLAFSNGRDVHLTAREWALLTRLARRPGAVLSKAQLEEALYDFGTEVESNTVEVYVSRLRRKLGRDLIDTMRGVGYCLRDKR